MSKLEQTLAQQLVKLEELKQILETELHLISSRDAESLINLLKSKEAVLEHIQTQDGVLTELYQQADQEQKTAGPIVELFEQAKEMVSQCQYRTQINQTAVDQGQLRLEHLRNLLLESRAKESLTYDKSGRTQGGTAGKGINA